MNTLSIRFSNKVAFSVILVLFVKLEGLMLTDENDNHIDREYSSVASICAVLQISIYAGAPAIFLPNSWHNNSIFLIKSRKYNLGEKTIIKCKQYIDKDNHE